MRFFNSSLWLLAFKYATAQLFAHCGHYGNSINLLVTIFKHPILHLLTTDIALCPPRSYSPQTLRYLPSEYGSQLLHQVAQQNVILTLVTCIYSTKSSHCIPASPSSCSLPQHRYMGFSRCFQTSYHTFQYSNLVASFSLSLSVRPLVTTMSSRGPACVHNRVWPTWKPCERNADPLSSSAHHL